MNAMKKYVENETMSKLKERKVKEIAKIFKLNVDCVEETFGCLLLEDLVSFGQTCKWFLQNAGVYFLENYADATDVLCGPDDLLTYRTSKRIEMDYFGLFLRRIIIRYDELKCFQRLETNCGQSLRQIELIGVKLTTPRIQCLKKFQNCIEKIFICECEIYVDFYKRFLKLFPKLKHLRVYQSTILLKDSGYEWLAQEYPMLERLEFRQQSVGRCEELMIFFQRNPNLKSFATDYKCLLENQDWIKTSNIKLDDLAIEINILIMLSEGVAEEFCSFLHCIHELGIYKRLHLYCNFFYFKQTVEQFMSLPALTKVNVGLFCGNIDLSSLTNVKELDLSYGNSLKFETISTHLERVSIDVATSDDILVLIRKSTALRKIKINKLKCGTYFDGKIIDLIALNKERQQLRNAQKISIYIEDSIFISTKWAMHETNLQLIEMKRNLTYDWDLFFFTD